MMTTLSQKVSNTGDAPGLECSEHIAVSSPLCPACAKKVLEDAIERYGSYTLFRCAACGLHFWEPRVMPDARWYEQMYGGRDEKLMSLEPGHKSFLGDALAPGRGG